MTEKKHNMDKLTEQYIALRNKIKKIKEAHKEELAPYNEALEKVENVFMQALLENGVDSMKTPHGTFYKSTVSRSSVADWDECFRFIVENEQWGILAQSVNDTAVKELAEQGIVVPGVTTKTITRVNVRK